MEERARRDVGLDRDGVALGRRLDSPGVVDAHGERLAGDEVREDAARANVEADVGVAELGILGQRDVRVGLERGDRVERRDLGLPVDVAGLERLRGGHGVLDHADQDLGRAGREQVVVVETGELDALAGHVGDEPVGAAADRRQVDVEEAVGSRHLVRVAGLQGRVEVGELGQQGVAVGGGIGLAVLAGEPGLVREGDPGGDEDGLHVGGVEGRGARVRRDAALAVRVASAVAISSTSAVTAAASAPPDRATNSWYEASVAARGTSPCVSPNV